ncbi:MAG: glycosyltransferase family 2 protein [Clostridium sp.]|uniref:glycosyltransferase family 2 protein n=1 Tax=Clostridium sp. TaxID=1506 RepID=UPI00305DB4A1
MNKIDISLCMIVKDEESVIERCITSIRDAVDEVIIVDTGSSDRTKEIAESLGCKIYDFKWIDNFAEARNYGFSKATKDYIMWLDADDVIGEESIKRLIDLKNNFDVSVKSVTMNYVLGQDTKGNTISSLRRNRLVKRSCGFKWIGAIHEYLAVEEPIINADIDIIHKKEKHYTDRNLRIFKSIISSGEILSVRDMFYYGNELYYNGLYDEAIEQYNKFLEFDEAWVEDRKIACKNLANCYAFKDDKDSALKILFKSFEFDAPRADFCCIIGDILLDRDIVDGAIFWYEIAAKWMPPKDYLALMDTAYYTWVPNLQLCVAYFKKGDIDKSVYHNEEAAKYIPDNPKIEYNRELFEKIKNNIKNNECD